jgi:hypothetical protein
MMTSEVISRGEAVQPHYGRTQANRLGSLPTGISAWINGTEVVNDTYGRLETDEERRAFFDEFLKVQRAGFGSAWVAIYQTVDLMRQNDWYWQSAGFDSFDAFWRQQGEALFGQWADLEATYQYAHLAAPQLFEVDYEEAKAIAQQLARFREVKPAMSIAEANKANGAKGGRPKTQGLREPSVSNPVNPADYIPELNSIEWRDGFNRGQLASKDAAGDSIKRFARLRRDAPSVADQFLAGEFIKRFKNGKPPMPDLKAAEIAAGIRKEGQTVRQRDGLAYCKQLASKLTAEQLQQLRDHINTILQTIQ